MAGHNKWSKIKHIKAVADKKKGREFSKVARLIMQAARESGGDPDSNIRLKYALDKAKQCNMPKDNVERAIKKGLGEVDGEAFQEVQYEGYGPGGVAILVETLTDNRNRTVGQVRNAFDRKGGNLGTTGCVSYLFDKKGVMSIASDQADEEKVMDLALEAGAEDVEPAEDTFEITTPPEVLDTLLSSFADAGIEVANSEVTMVPQNTVPVAADDAQTLLDLLDELDELEDVQGVHSNADLPDDFVPGED